MTNTAAKKRAFVEGIFPFEWDLYFCCRNSFLKGTELIIVSIKTKENLCNELCPKKSRNLLEKENTGYIIKKTTIWFSTPTVSGNQTFCRVFLVRFPFTRGLNLMRKTRLTIYVPLHLVRWNYDNKFLDSMQCQALHWMLSNH